MVVKSKVKYIQSLSHKKQRDADGVFVAEGPKIVNELLAEKRVELVELFALKEAAESLASLADGKLTEIDESTLERMSQLSTPNQVLAVFRKPPVAPLRLQGMLTLMLDGVQDPGNVGTILRCADWFGVRQVVCSADCADVFGPKAVQSTMASIGRVQVWYEDLAALLRPAEGIAIYAAMLDGTSIYEMPRVQEGVIVIGNESKGVSDPVAALVTSRITIPRRGHAESLNAAIAAAVILSHLAG